MRQQYPRALFLQGAIGDALQPVSDGADIGLGIGAHVACGKGHQVTQIGIAQHRHGTGDFDPQGRIGNIQADADHQHAAGVIVGDDGGVEGLDRQIAFRLGDLVFRLFGVGGVLGVVGGPCGRRHQKGDYQAKAKRYVAHTLAKTRIGK